MFNSGSEFDLSYKGFFIEMDNILDVIYQVAPDIDTEVLENFIKIHNEFEKLNEASLKDKINEANQGLSKVSAQLAALSIFLETNQKFLSQNPIISQPFLAATQTFTNNLKDRMENAIKDPAIEAQKAPWGFQTIVSNAIKAFTKTQAEAITSLIDNCSKVNSTLDTITNIGNKNEAEMLHGSPTSEAEAEIVQEKKSETMMPRYSQDSDDDSDLEDEEKESIKFRYSQDSDDDSDFEDEDEEDITSRHSWDSDDDSVFGDEEKKIERAVSNQEEGPPSPITIATDFDKSTAASDKETTATKNQSDAHSEIITTLLNAASVLKNVNNKHITMEYFWQLYLPDNGAQTAPLVTLLKALGNNNEKPEETLEKILNSQADGSIDLSHNTDYWETLFSTAIPMIENTNDAPFFEKIMNRLEETLLSLNIIDGLIAELKAPITSTEQASKATENIALIRQKIQNMPANIEESYQVQLTSIEQKVETYTADALAQQQAEALAQQQAEAETQFTAELDSLFTNFDNTTGSLEKETQATMDNLIETLKKGIISNDFSDKYNELEAQASNWQGHIKAIITATEKQLQKIKAMPEHIQEKHQTNLEQKLISLASKMHIEIPNDSTTLDALKAASQTKASEAIPLKDMQIALKLLEFSPEKTGELTSALKTAAPEPKGAINVIIHFIRCLMNKDYKQNFEKLSAVHKAMDADHTAAAPEPESPTNQRSNGRPLI